MHKDSLKVQDSLARMTELIGKISWCRKKGYHVPWNYLFKTFTYQIDEPY